MDVIEHCAGNLEPYIKQFLVSSISGDITRLNNSVDYHEVIYDVYQCAPQILYGIVPYITGVLLVSTPYCSLLALLVYCFLLYVQPFYMVPSFVGIIITFSSICYRFP